MRIALLVVEIVVVLAALFSGAVLVLKGRRTPGGLADAEKRRTIVNLLVTDAILVLMAVAAWATYEERSWARMMSVIAGALLVCALALRPEVAGKKWWAAPVGAALGVAVVVLAFFMPSGGG